MTNFKKQLARKIIGITSFGVLLIGVVSGLVAKGDSPKTGQANNSSASSPQIEGYGRITLGEEAEQPSIYSELLEEDETALALKEYSESEELEYMFVGCGGFF
jgi:hypothetical protein